MFANNTKSAYGGSRPVSQSLLWSSSGEMQEILIEQLWTACDPLWGLPTQKTAKPITCGSAVNSKQLRCSTVREVEDSSGTSGST